MKNQPLWQKSLTWLIVALVILLCAGLAAGGVILYFRGTAAVQAGTAETVFTREQAAGLLRLFAAPALLLALLLITAAFVGAKKTQLVSPDRKATLSPRHAGTVSAYRGLSARRRWLILAIAAGLIAAGVLNGGLRDVLIKAVNICTECIGLG